MNPSPVTPDPKPPTPGRSVWPGWLNRPVLGTGVFLAAALGGAAWRGVAYVQHELAPGIENELERSLDRPVKLGALQWASLNRLNFGPSEIPPQPGSEPAADFARAAGVEIDFNLWDLLWRRQLNLDVTLQRPQVQLVQTRDGRWLRTSLKPQPQTGWWQTRLKALRFDQALVTAIPWGGNPRELQVGGALVPEATNGGSDNLNFNLTGRVNSGGQVKLQGTWNPTQQDLQLSLETQNLPASFLNDLEVSFSPPPVGKPAPPMYRLQAGEVSSQLEVHWRAGQTSQGQTSEGKTSQSPAPKVTGKVWLRGVSGRLAGLPQALRNLQGELQLRGNRADIERLSGSYGTLAFQSRGEVDPKRGVNLVGRILPVEINTAAKALQLRVPVKLAGQVQIPDLRLSGPLSKPQLTGTLLGSPGTTIDRLQFRGLAVQFRATAPKLELAIQAEPSVGGKIVGQGRYDPSKGDPKEGGRWESALQATGVPADALAKLYQVNSPVAIGPVDALIQSAGSPTDLLTQVQFQAPQSRYPTRGVAVIRQGQIWLQEAVSQVGSGTVRSAGRLDASGWQLSTLSRNLPLGEFDPQNQYGLRGTVSGPLNLRGRAGVYNPASVQALGQLQFSQGLGNFRQPLVARIGWDGKSLQVLQARSSEGILAAGTLNTRLDRGLEITGLDLEVGGQDYDLRQLSALGINLTDLPGGARLQGRIDFRGRLTGPLNAPRLEARLQNRSLSVNQLGFEPGMKGGLIYDAREGTGIQLVGERDRIQIELDPSNLPRVFSIRRGQAAALGRREGEQFQIALRQFPLAELNLRVPNQTESGPVRGLLDGDFSWRLSNNDLTGQLTIRRPNWSGLQGEQLQATVNFENGITTAQGVLISMTKRQYRFNARLGSGRNPELQGQVSTTAGQLQELVALLERVNPSLVNPSGQRPAYAKAADIGTIQVGDSQAPLSVQIQRLQAVQTQLAQQPATAARRNLDINQLQGDFRGELNFASTQQRGLTAQFNLAAEQPNLGDTKLERAIVQGNVANNQTNIQALRVEADGGALNFSGTLGGSRQQGTLSVDNLPVDLVRQYIGIPTIDVTGRVGGQADLSGSLNDPRLQGQLQLQNATLNQRPLENAVTRFNYQQERLEFTGTALMDGGPEPIRIAGSLPVALPLSRRRSGGDQISLDLQVRNEGLSLLGLFTDAVRWQSGQGSVNLQVRGTLQEPQLLGLVDLQGVNLQAKTLDQPLTGVTGRLRFTGGRLRVEQLQGHYSTGKLLAEGVLPLTTPLAPTDPDHQTPLRLSLKQVDLRLPNLYSGKISGDMVMGGTIRQPNLGGNIQLQAGQVFLEGLEQQTTVAQTLSANGNGRMNMRLASLPAVSQAYFSPLQLQNLQVQLGEGVEIRNNPLFSFLGLGNINLNGTLDDIRPQGTIQFKDGQINLFTSRFRLAPGVANFAEFVPSQGLDPNLNVSLLTTVTEVYGTRLNRLNDFEPTPVGSLGSLSSVRVRARVVGRASQLESGFSNVVEFSSTPSRSQEEILALLGGGLNRSPVQNSNARLALVNLAGQALFNNIQGFLNDVVSERVTFRLFPALIPVRRQAATQANTPNLGLGAEMGYDLTSKLSISAIQVLTAPDNPTQFNLGYQFNDNWRFSTSIDWTGAAAGLLEYRLRF